MKRDIENSGFMPQKGNPLHETVIYKIGGTFYEVSTSCGGSEPLYSKMKRLIKAKTVKTHADKEREVRYNEDSTGDNDFTPFRNLFNDFYARDTSKKIRAVMRSKGNAGEHLCSNPPYGYRKDSADKKRWIIDEEAAEVVKRIFDLCIAGKGPMQIAKVLTADKVLTVKAYYAKRDGKAMPDNLYRWDYKSIAGILERPEYTGCTVNFKTYSKSHKLKKRLQNAPENYRIFPNTQPAIVEEKVFERVQELRANKRRPTKTRTARLIFRLALLCRLWGKAVLLHNKQLHAQAGALCLLQLQEQYRYLFRAFYQRRNLKVVRLEKSI